MEFVIRSGTVGRHFYAIRFFSPVFGPFRFWPVTTTKIWTKVPVRTFCLYHRVFQLPTFRAVRVLIGSRVRSPLPFYVVHILSVLHDAGSILYAANGAFYFMHRRHECRMPQPTSFVSGVIRWLSMSAFTGLLRPPSGREQLMERTRVFRIGG